MRKDQGKKINEVESRQRGELLGDRRCSGTHRVEREKIVEATSSERGFKRKGLRGRKGEMEENRETSSDSN